ncbi:uncharacterized protein LOC135480551 [Liolophura sinensis]|uniref:uncharacterized protein LOC135480551 n=1 Tax=Liolophura sinensis TaxID=3198878 RepID=UPI00315813A0
MLVSLPTWSGNNGRPLDPDEDRQVRRSVSESSSDSSSGYYTTVSISDDVNGLEHGERQRRSSSVELDTLPEFLALLPKTDLNESRESDAEVCQTLCSGVISDVQANQSPISSVSRDFRVRKSPTTKSVTYPVLPDISVSQPLTLDMSCDLRLKESGTYPVSPDLEISRSLITDESPYRGESQSLTSDVSSDLEITHSVTYVGSSNLKISQLLTFPVSPDVQISQPLKDITTPTVSVLSSPISPDIEEDIPVVFMAQADADINLSPKSAVLPEDDSSLSSLLSPSPEDDVDQSEDFVTLPVDVLDESPDVLEDPCFTQATLDSIASARLTPLIKQELKCLIQVRRHFDGLDLSPIDSNRDKLTEDPYQPTEEDIRRRLRRRDLNKLSARRCREKKNEQETLLEQEAEKLSDGNQTLRKEIIALRKEMKFLEKALLSHRPCKRQKLYPKSNQDKASGE